LDKNCPKIDFVCWSYDAPPDLLVRWGGKYLLPLSPQYIRSLDVRSGFYKYDHLATLGTMGVSFISKHVETEGDVIDLD